MRLLTANSFEPIFAPLLGRRVGYVPTTGGVGDMLVEMAALQLFASFGVEYSIETLAGECDADVLVLAGGGPDPAWPPDMEERIAAIAAEVPITVLPRSLTTGIGFRARRFHVRDRDSLVHRPDGILMPDLILGLEIAVPREPEEERGVWLRCDHEGRFTRYGGEDPDDVCGTAVEYLALAARYQVIVTDRPEFAIAGLLQGREVSLLPTASGVNRSLWETWLADFGCHWLDARDVLEADAAISAPHVPQRTRATGLASVGQRFAPANAFDPRGMHRILARYGADLRALKARMAGWERSQEQLVRSVAETHERLLRQGDDVQASIYALQNELRVREPVAPSTDGAAGEKRRLYSQLVAKIRGGVRDRLPREASVLVISRGDDDLLRLFGRRAGHFPQGPDGGYLGYHPPDAVAAVGHLLELAAAGWEYLLIPATALWWLDHYIGFRAHLARSCAVVHRDTDCVIVALHVPSPWAELTDFVADFKVREHRFPAILDWVSGSGLADAFPELPVFHPPDPAGNSLPYLEASIDIVAVPRDDDGRRNEALRVATVAVVEVDSTASTPNAVVIHRLGRHGGTVLQRTAVIRPVLRGERRLP